MRRPGARERLTGDSLNSRSTERPTRCGFYKGTVATRGNREKDQKAMYGTAGEEEAALEWVAEVGRVGVFVWGRG